MFTQHQEAINSASTGSPSKTFTGIAPVRILAINPTESALADLIGAESAAKFDTNYAINTRDNQDYRNVVIWYTDFEQQLKPSITQITLGSSPLTFNSGNSLLVNRKMQSAISTLEKITFNSRMKWFDQEGMRVSLKGEVDYMDFMAKLLRFDFKSEAVFEDVLASEGIDFKTVFEGDFTGLRKLSNYIKENEMFVHGLFTVKEKANDDGKVFYNQNLILRPTTTFRTDGEPANDYHHNKLIGEYNRSIENEFDFVKDLFTAKFQEFKKEDCINYEAAPEDVASMVGDTLEGAPGGYKWG